MKYAPGTWYALVTKGGCVILEPGSPVETVLDLWESLSQGEGFPGVLQRIITEAGSTLAALPSFAIVIREESGVHIAVRGRLSVRCLTSKGPMSVEGSQVMTWREEMISEPIQVGVTCDENQAGVWWPLTEGIVQASAVCVVGEPESIPPAESSPAFSADALPSILSDPSAVEGPTMFPVVADVSPVVPDAHKGFSPVEYTGQITLMTDDDIPADDSSEEDPELKSTTFYRGLLADPGSTPLPSPEAVPPIHPGSPPSTEETQDDHDGMTVLGVPAPAVVDVTDHDGMTVMSLDNLDDHDGMTVMGAPGIPPAATPPPPLSPPPGPLVLARICPTCRTPNSTRRVQCRSCGMGLQGDAQQIPRPALGQLKLPDGEVMTIDHPLVIGRKPEASRFSSADIPILVRVDDPHVSSTHLRVDLEDWSVLVTSLGRNGTILRRPGQPDRRFTEGEQIIAQAGDEYCLSAELSVAILELA